MTQFEERVLTDLAELKARMRWLVGDGNEGKLHEIETRMQKHDASLQRMAGVGGTVGVVLTILHVALDYLKVVHR